ncbi:YjgB family protein [Paenibacillus sp. FSL H8-0034]|uniref:YjgB family protein n=1 Tax=Paenibacillus sp. FSL H8-0034 TaxID=2954671 RepID=UPI0030FC099A
MKPQIKALAYSMMLAGVLTLAACNSDSKTAAPAAPDPAAAAPAAPTNNTAPGPTPAAPTNNTTPSPAPTAASPTTAPAPSSAPTAAAGSEDTSKQLKELLEQAKQGKIPGIKYAAHTALIDEVEKDWGKADKQDSAGKGFVYATYSKKNAVLGFNKGMLIFDVRSNDPSLHKLTLQQIEQALGKPADIKLNGDDTIYIFKANDQFQLKFIIPKSTGKVDHISVFSPQDSVNFMAE